MADGNIRNILVGGFFTVFGGLGGAWLAGQSQLELANRKFNSELVLKALESESPSERVATLTMLVDTKLLKDSEVSAAVKDYATKNAKEIPQVLPAPVVAPSVQVVPSTLEAPIVPDARVYLLAGKKEKRELFDGFEPDLKKAGYRIYGRKVIEDSGRPAAEEVRYFFEDDKDQAKKLAEFLAFNLGKESVDISKHTDPVVRRGYIEMWLGK